MRNTILSRCAPSFSVQVSHVDDIVNRLKQISEFEGISVSEESLKLLVQSTDNHIRDALKALEGSCNNKSVTLQTVKSYLHLDNLDKYYEILLNISDLPQCANLLENILQKDSPTQFYSRIIEICLEAYKVQLGVSKPPNYLDASKLTILLGKYGKNLLDFSKFLSDKLYKPTKTTALCDLYSLSQIANPNFKESLNTGGIKTILSSKDTKESIESTFNTGTLTEPQKLAPKVPITTNVKVTTDGVYVNPRAINTNRISVNVQPNPVKESAEMEPTEFKWLLKLKLVELGIHGNRKT
jgi:DNA polymerase III gamma/tau subunit